MDAEDARTSPVVQADQNKETIDDNNIIIENLVKPSLTKDPLSFEKEGSKRRAVAATAQTDDDQKSQNSVKNETIEDILEDLHEPSLSERRVSFHKELSKRKVELDDVKSPAELEAETGKKSRIKKQICVSVQNRLT